MARLTRVLEQLGLATVGWLALTLVEVALRRPAIDVDVVLGYLLGAALLLSCSCGAGLLAVHVAYGALSARWPRRALVATAGLLAVIGLAPAYLLSGALVEGEWIAKQPWVGAFRVALAVGCLLAWLGVCAFYAASHALATPRARALWWLAAIAALTGLSLALQGPLLAYQALGRGLVFPAWLIAFACAQQLSARWSRAARYVGLVAVVLGVLACVRHALDEDLLRYARSEAEASTSFAAIAQTLVVTRSVGLGVLAFEEARDAVCPAPRQPAALALRPEQRRNVIWLSIDTMRRDAIGKRFGGRAVAPSIEAFGTKSVFFSRAVSPAAGTLFSMTAALTGHSVTQLLYMTKPPANVFHRARKELPEQRIVLPDWGMFRAQPFKALITQGAPVTQVERKREPLQPFLDAIDSARERGRRGFFWLHLVDAHLPYTHHKQFGFGDHKVAHYYSEVAFDDAIVGRALVHLEARGCFEDSLIVVFSDHGEALGENGYFGHGISMRARYTDIPLYVRHPGVTPRTSNAAVSLTSLPATVLHYLGLPIPKTIADCSLLEPDAALERCRPPVSTSYGLRSEFLYTMLKKPIASHDALEPRQQLVAKEQRHPPEVAFTTSTHRYLLNRQTGAERLFDRERDPGEEHNLVREDRALAARFRGIAERWAEDEAALIACRVGDR